MSEYTVIENPSASLWRSFLSKFSDGNFEQCFEQGEIAKTAYPNTNVVRLAITCDKKPMGIVLGAYSSYFGFGMTLRVMRGPLVNEMNKERLRLAEALLKALEDFGKRRRIIQAQILTPERWQLDKLFYRLGYSAADELNEYVVNLEKGADALWKSISHNKRRNIKKAMKAGVEVVQSHNLKDLCTFYSMLEASANRGGFLTQPLSWFETVWKVYKPVENSKVFLARWKGKEVSGVFIAVNGRTVYALAAGSLKEGWKVRPNDMMHWKVMEWACQNGYSKYHMGFVSEPPPTEGSNAWGIWRWKKEWQGNLEKMQAFEKTFLPRYKFVLKAKKLIERGYTSLRQLR